MIESIASKIKSFLDKYTVPIHLLLTGWNIFLTSWATGLDMPLETFGLPIHYNARDIVSFIQAHTHVPTTVIGIVTLVANASIAYAHWKKNHVQVTKVPEGSVLIATPSTTEKLSTETIIKAE